MWFVQPLVFYLAFVVALSALKSSFTSPNPFSKSLLPLLLINHPLLGFIARDLITSSLADSALRGHSGSLEDSLTAYQQDRVLNFDPTTAASCLNRFSGKTSLSDHRQANTRSSLAVRGPVENSTTEYC